MTDRPETETETIRTKLFFAFKGVVDNAEQIKITINEKDARKSIVIDFGIEIKDSQQQQRTFLLVPTLMRAFNSYRGNSLKDKFIVTIKNVTQESLDNVDEHALKKNVQSALKDYDKRKVKFSPIDDIVAKSLLSVVDNLDKLKPEDVPALQKILDNLENTDPKKDDYKYR